MSTFDSIVCNNRGCCVWYFRTGITYFGGVVMNVKEMREAITNYCDSCSGCEACILDGNDWCSTYKCETMPEEGIIHLYENLTTNSDDVHHPQHYIGSNGIECWDAMEAAFGKESLMEFCLLNAFKYLYRCKHKNNTLEDIKKARAYIEKWEELNG